MSNRSLKRETENTSGVHDMSKKMGSCFISFSEKKHTSVLEFPRDLTPVF